MRLPLNELATYARYPFTVRSFLKQTLTLEQARATVLERLARRNDNFLAIAEHSIYGNPSSPYLPLLANAGCDLGGLKALVQQKGLENALGTLREQGVYITFEEFKGRVPVVRGGKTLAIQPKDFDNPLARGDIRSSSGGSTGAPTQLAQDMEHLAARMPHSMLAMDAYGTLDGPLVVWRGILPDAGTLESLLRHSVFGRLTNRWFSNIGLRESKHWIKYGLATYYMLFWARLYGAPIPFPEYATTAQAEVIVRCLTELRDKHGRCALSSQVSRALRVALAAEDLGLDLQGVTITGGGEPATPAKVNAIERTGARFFSNYSMREAGTLGYACADSTGPDDLHFFSDAHALFSYPQPVAGFDLTVPAFHLTTLLATAPKILLNLQSDDYGHIETRACGCKLGALGYTTHLARVRSYHKLTGEAVTLVASDLVTILEDVLPARFGGSPLDYQWQEKEDEKGFTRLYLVIHPRLEIPDERLVRETVLQALGTSSPMSDAARTVWQQTDSIVIERAEPIWTARGKLMPLHLQHK